MASSSSSSSHKDIVSFPLKLKSTTTTTTTTAHHLHCSLHKVSNPSQLAKNLKDHSDNNSNNNSNNSLALINAKRLVGLNQLYCAANLSINRRNPTWDTVFAVAASSHLGHVLNDYAFLEPGTNNSDGAAATAGCCSTPVAVEEESVVVIFQISNDATTETYQGLLERYGLLHEDQTNSHNNKELPRASIHDYFADRLMRKEVRQDLKVWYKLTDQELETASLESCILTKIATKMM